MVNDVGPASKTVGQHWTNIGSMSRIWYIGLIHHNSSRKWNEMNRALGHLYAHIGWTGPGEPREDGEIIEMTLSSRHRIRNSSPGGQKSSTLPLGLGGSPQYWLSHVDGEETIFCFFQTAETGNRTPNSGVKGSGANHYPRAHTQLFNNDVNKWVLFYAKYIYIFIIDQRIPWMKNMNRYHRLLVTLIQR